MRVLTDKEVHSVAGGYFFSYGFEYSALNFSRYNSPFATPVDSIWQYTNSDGSHYYQIDSGGHSYVATDPQSSNSHLPDISNNYSASAPQLANFDLNNLSSQLDGFQIYGNTVSDDAKSYANGVILNLGSSDQHYVDRVYNDVAQFYDYAIFHAGDTIKLASGNIVTYYDALQYLQQTGITISDSLNVTGGAVTQPNGDYTSANIILNPSHYNQQGYQNNFGNAGVDYVVFHEIGHDLSLKFDFQNFSNESAANSIGKNIEDHVGFVPMSAPPGYGYYSGY